MKPQPTNGDVAVDGVGANAMDNGAKMDVLTA
jgi:hypothetical protein